MSLATKSNVITNGLPNDGSQVEQNFNDLIGFMNASMPHSDGTGGAADIRAPKFGNASLNGKRLHWGSFSLTTAGDAKATITHGAGFTPRAVQMIATSGVDTASNWWSAITDTYTGTTFRAQWRTSNGTAAVSVSVAGFFLCLE
jgi:hypothetical protein